MTRRCNASQLVVAAVALACASAAGAQQLDVDKLAADKIQPASCREVVWQEELIARHPKIVDACQEVIVSDGRKFARFTGELVRFNRRDGTVKVQFHDRKGSSLGELTLKPNPDQRVLIEGRKYRFSELEPGRGLNLYVPESLFAVATEPDARPEAMVQIVPEDAAGPAAQEPLPRLARSTPQASAPARAARLPDTASEWPWVAAFGVLAILGALVVRMRRSATTPTNT